MVAICVVLVEEMAVGAVGVPEKLGDDIGAAPKFTNAFVEFVAPVPPLANAMFHPPVALDEAPDCLNR